MPENQAALDAALAHIRECVDCQMWLAAVWEASAESA